MRYLALMLLLIFTMIKLSAKPNADFIVTQTSGCSPLRVVFTDMSSGNPTSWYWDFGNGQTSILKIPDVTFITPGKYTITLIASNSTGSSTKTKTQYITVFRNPIADFTVNKNIGCVNINLVFTDKSLQGDASIISWLWTFGDGESSTSKNPVHAFKNAGIYNITLMITDNNGCVSFKTQNSLVEIKAVKADFAAINTYYCSIPAFVNFINQSVPSSTIIKYLWTFGDGKTSTSQNISNTYTNTGKYTVKLKVEDQFGCTDEYTRNNYIEVENFNADFDYTIDDSCTPAHVEFKNKSTNLSGLSYFWNFGDNTTSIIKDPGYTYNNGGDFTVRLTVSKNGCSSSIAKVIHVYSVPLVNFSADTQTFCKIPFNVKFSVNLTGNYSFLWDFGDGRTSTTQKPSHQYNAFGKYTVSLKITNNSTGCFKSFVNYDYIEAQPPDVVLKIGPASGCAPLLTTFEINDKSLIPFTQWIVNSGNGKINTTKNGMFVYKDTGIYYLTIKARNNRGCEFDYTQVIKVGNPPQADFMNFFYRGCNDTFLQFTNLTNTHDPKADGYFWKFGDGGTSVEENPTHKYKDTGYMNVTLIAYKYDCPDSIVRKKMIYINAPIAIIKDTTLCYPANMSNLNISIGGTSWFWDFGDRTYSTLKNPVHSYSPGTYKVLFTVADQITHCIDKDSTEIIVAVPPKDYFIADKIYACSGSFINFSDTSTKKLKYSWTFSNGKKSSDKLPSIEFKDGGLYSATLTITDTNQCSYTVTRNNYIKISDIHPNFSVSKDHGCIPLYIELTDNSYSLIKLKERKWDFGNGKIMCSYNKDTNYTYTRVLPNKSQINGCQLTLTITDSIGCTASTSQTITPSDPRASMALNMNDNCKKTQVGFNAVLNDTNVIKPAMLKWYLNHVYNTYYPSFNLYFSGDTTINVTLVMTDLYGCTDSSNRSIVISNNPPKANFGYNINSSINNCPPVVVSFANVSKAGKKKIIRYFWDFGNKSYSTLENPTNSYSEPGTFSVSLIAEDESGCRDTMLKPYIIKVNGATGTFNVFPTEGCVPLNCTFIPHTSKAVEYYWNFGDGNTSNDSITDHKYIYGGVFNPIMVLKDSLGCLTSYTTKDSIHVFNNPQALFSVYGRMTCLGNYTRFYNQTVYEQSINIWEWDLGNGYTSNLFEPLFVYPDTGKYDVSLKVTDVEGCKDSISHPAIVYIYYDTIKPDAPFIYKTSHLVNEPVLDEILFSKNHDSDFRNVTIFRSNSCLNVQTLRRLPLDLTDTLIFDTIFPKLIPQCYYLQTSDYCANESVASKLHCLIFLKVSALAEGNNLVWTAYKGWDSVEKYSIYRKKSADNDSFLPIAEVGGNTLNYLDTNVICSDIYHYIVSANEKNGFQQISISNTDSVKTTKIMQIAATKLIRVSVEDGNVLLEWDKLNLNFDHKYMIFRSYNNLPEQAHIEADSSWLNITDKAVKCNDYSYNYRIKVLQTGCKYLGNPSNLGRTILLKIFKSDDENKLMLFWNFYKQWDEGVDHYEIEYLNQLTNQFEIVGITSPDTSIFFHPFDPMNLKHYYRVRAVQKFHPDIVSNSNIASYILEPRVNIPNTFTPDNDGLNDVFIPVCYGCKVVKMQIYSRWGELLYESSANDAAWNGKFKDQLCPLGVYLYVIIVSTEDALKTYSGDIMILR